jgi:nitrogen-specific signal transduction histidine kinase
LLTAGAAAAEPVEISVTQDSARTYITVGKGGPKGDTTSPAPLHPGIFEPFTLHNHHGVNGLALATVRSVICAHGGDIAVVTDGGAAHFVVSLPGAA